jgi:hypothetical protein
VTLEPHKSINGVKFCFLHLLALCCGWAGKSKYCPPWQLKGKRRLIHELVSILRIEGSPPLCERALLVGPVFVGL